jgi:hypothetical protein
MAWTTPKTWTPGELVTAATMNLQVRDNLTDLDARTTAAAQSTVLFDDTQKANTLTTYDTLFQRTMAAGTLATVGDTVVFRATGTFANTNAYQSVLLAIAGVSATWATTYMQTAGPGGGFWVVEMLVTKIAPGQQRIATMAMGGYDPGAGPHSAAATGLGTINELTTAMDLQVLSNSTAAGLITYEASWFYRVR